MQFLRSDRSEAIYSPSSWKKSVNYNLTYFLFFLDDLSETSCLIFMISESNLVANYVLVEVGLLGER